MTPLLPLLLVLAPPEQSAAQIEQLAPAARPADAANLPQGRPDPRVSQLPQLLAPIEGTDEERLKRTPTDDPSGWTTEVLKALQIIRSRGQQPTPELIARELSPDALQAYLNQAPDLKGSAPEPPPPDLPPAGVTLLPPKLG
jgi:hypothetical protein